MGFLYPDAQVQALENQLDIVVIDQKTVGMINITVSNDSTIRKKEY